MNQSSSFELSSETLEKTFCEYTESDISDSSQSNIHLVRDIKNPVKQKVNELAQLQVQSKISSRAIHKIVPLISSTPGASIDIPNGSRFFKSSVHKAFAFTVYVNCTKCNELVEYPQLCHKCNTAVKKGMDNYLIYIPIERQIEACLIEHFQKIREHLNRKLGDDFMDVEDGAIQRKIIEQYPAHKILSLTLNTDGGRVAEKSNRSLWPVQLYQNYLPANIRFLPQNILVVGLFYGENKPNPFDLLFPLLKDLRNLSETGMQLMYDGNQYDFLPMLLYLFFLTAQLS